MVRNPVSCVYTIFLLIFIKVYLNIKKINGRYTEHELLVLIVELEVYAPARVF
jgi:hypothetical protein